MNLKEARKRVDEIHALAAKQLENPDPAFDAMPLITELRRIELSPKLLPDLEARIMLFLGARMKPTRTRVLLRTLRGRREEAGESEKFDAFEAYLQKAIGADVLVGHDFAPETFAQLDHVAVWSDVTAAVVGLSNLSKAVFLNSGTLLGAVRDGKLIDHDDDIDLGLLLDAGNAEEAATAWLELKDELMARNLLDDVAQNEPEIYKIRTSGKYHLDVFPAWIGEGRLYVYPHTFGELAEGDLLPVRTGPVTGLPIPAEPEKMLEVNYGAGWRVPDPYYKFPWGPQRRKFAAFREALAASEAKEKVGTVITYGTFDLFHVGHVRLLRRLAALGERLVVGCSTDEFNAIKGKSCVMPYEDRAEILRACDYVDDVFPENDWGQKRGDIVKYGADMFAMGDDWEGKFDDLSDLCRVVYLPRTENISTTELKERVSKRAKAG